MMWSIGTTYDESAMPLTQEARVLEALSRAGFRSLELALHEKAMTYERAQSVCRLTAEHGFDLAFHAPDFCEPSGFDLNEVMSVTGSKTIFSRWLDQCGSLSGSSQVIFHGASGRDATLRFIDWALEYTEKARTHQWLLLENTYDASDAGRRYGQLSHELLETVRTFEGSRLGLCLDTAHWLRAMKDDVYRVSPELLLNKIHRLHLHSVEPTSGLDHQPLTEQDQPTRRLIEDLFATTSLQRDGVSPWLCCSLEILETSLAKAGQSKHPSWLDAVLSSGIWLNEVLEAVAASKDSKT